jgi:2-iminobutanoate/2-iminopropanoate deaminase
MKTIISTNQAPKAIGPYSQAVLANGFLFISGQLPINPETGNFPDGGIKEQASQSLENVKAILSEAKLSLNDVVKTTVFLSNIEDFAAMNEVYSQYFMSDCPARSAFQVANLPKSAFVEIEVIAAVK